MFLKKVKKYIEEYRLVEQGDKVLLAVSGGPDSMALMEAFHLLAPVLKVTLHVVHLDHRFRGEEAAQDAEFVRQEAAKRGIPATILAFDVPAYGKRHRMSSQDAARRIRYGLFLEVAEKVGASRMAVAHHRDDQVETVLINILRGTGPEGLRGMKPVRRWSEYGDLSIIRPLLGVSRPEIEAYLEEKGILSRLDRTNLKDTYLRNKVRLRLLPALEQEYNPAIRESILSLSALMADVEEYMAGETFAAWQKVFLSRRQGKVTLDRERFLAQPKALQGKLLRYALLQLLPGLRGISYRHIRDLQELTADGRTGAALSLPGGVKALIFYGELHLSKGAGEAGKKGGVFEPLSLPVPGEAALPHTGRKIVAAVLARDEMPWPPAEDREALLDFDRLPPGAKVTVRRRRPGDRFQPLGLQGTKKLKDFFIDKRIPREERDRLPLVTLGCDILWVVGVAIHERFKITAETGRILHLKVEELGDLTP